MANTLLINDSYFNYYSKLYEYYLTRRDERFLNWPLVGNINHMFYLIIFYYLFIGIGKRLMKNQKPFELRYPLIAHNLLCTLLSIYMVVEISRQAIINDYSLVCNPVDYTEKGLGMAKVLWLFYFSKYIEFLDTIFMVLRKKNNQITFLHVFHHSTMPIPWILVMWYVAGGDSYISALMNSIIHTIMYSYYTLALFNINVWWKKYLTQIQLLQFVVNISASAYSIYNDCNFVKGLHWLMIGYMFCFVLLFGAFYLKTYISPSKKKSN